MIELCALTPCRACSIVGTQLHVDGVVDSEPDKCIQIGAAPELYLGAAPELQNIGAAPEVLKAEADRGAPHSPLTAQASHSPAPAQPRPLTSQAPHGPGPSQPRPLTSFSNLCHPRAQCRIYLVHFRVISFKH